MADIAFNLVVAPKHFTVLGVKLSAVQIPDVISQVEQWIADGSHGKYVAVANVHMVMEAVHHSDFANILANADLVVPDGMPLIWSARMQGRSLQRRVYGPDILFEFCRDTQDRNYRHFFFGGEAGIAEKMVENFKKQFKINCVGTLSPPFRKLSDVEERDIAAEINAARPDIVWVCLGCPKQERWMYDHRTQINAAAMVGVGQAFDIYAGTLKQAPSFMRENGFEWLFRLSIEPKRLWRRYLIYNSKFIYCHLLQLLKLRTF